METYFTQASADSANCVLAYLWFLSVLLLENTWHRYSVFILLQKHVTCKLKFWCNFCFTIMIYTESFILCKKKNAIRLQFYTMTAQFVNKIAVLKQINDVCLSTCLGRLTPHQCLLWLFYQHESEQLHESQY